MFVEMTSAGCASVNSLRLSLQEDERLVACRGNKMAIGQQAGGAGGVDGSGSRTP